MEVSRSDGASCGDRPGRAAWAMTVDRGPDWVFLRLDPAASPPEDDRPLAERLWEVAQTHGAHRVVVEFDHIPSIDSSLIEAITVLSLRVHDAGGLLRVCGLSEAALARLRSSVRADQVPHFESRFEAVGAKLGVGA